VSFDGSSGIGQPVKCFETVIVAAGDRVGLVKFEGEWIIVGSYTPRTFGKDKVLSILSSTSTVPGTLFVDMPTSPTCVLTKYRDSTQFDIDINASIYSHSGGAMVAEVGVLIAFPDGTSLDQALFHRAFSIAEIHQDLTGGLRTSLTLPGGAYSLTARWRRVSGTAGTLTMDANDSITLTVEEVVP
jgi:hypothetical protein